MFKIGDKVLVFDKLTKLNSLGTVVNIISKNSYTVDINGVSKHISGDNMSHTVIIDNDNDNDNDSENEKDNVSITGSDSDTDTDNISIISDDDFDSNSPVTPNLRVIPQQTVRNNPPAPVSPRKLRSGRVYKSNKHYRH